MIKICEKFPTLSLKDQSLLFQLKESGTIDTLSLKFLYGTSSASINDLFQVLQNQTKLKNILFDSCDLSCHNFSSWFRFDNLSALTLAHCELKDFDVESLFFNSPFQLTQLDLSFNHLTIKSLPLLTKYLGSKSLPLQQLNLTGNEKLFFGDTISSLCTIYNNDYVTSNEQYSDAIELFFIRLQNIREVNFSKTRFNFQLCKLFSKLLKDSHLLKLDLSQNTDINDLCCHWLKDISNIRSLNLSHCSITDFGFFNLVPDLLNLNDINICANSLTMTNIPTDLTRFNIRSLNLSKNPMVLENIKVLPQLFPNLCNIHLHSCKIHSFDCIQPLLKRLKLNSIILWDNRLRFNDLIKIEQTLTQNDNNKCHVDLRYNNISAKSLKIKKFADSFDLRINNDPLVDLF